MERRITVFFAFQFGGAHIAKADRETALLEAVKEARAEIVRDSPDYEIDWEECVLESGRQVGEQIVELIFKSDIFIADISEYNANVLFELGVAYAVQQVSPKRIIWLAHESVDLSKVPSDLRGLYIDRYEGKSLRSLLARKIRDFTRTIIRERSDKDREALVRRFWNLPEKTNLDIVCSEIPVEERPYFANPLDRNYLRYAKFADLDSLIHVRTRIAQLFPDIGIRDFSPSEYFDTNTQGLIVIGGPPWNAKFREFQHQLPFHFNPNPLGKDDPLHVDMPAMEQYSFGPKWKKNGELINDISLFVRVRLNAKVPVFLLGGCLTFGVLGAAKCFLEEDVAYSNIECLERYVQGRDFIIVFETKRMAGFVRTPDFVKNQPLAIISFEPGSQDFKVLVNKAEEYRA